MTTLAPRPAVPSRLRDRPAVRRRTPTTLVVGTLAGLALTALVNSDDLVRAAERLPYGSQRSVAVRLAELDHGLAHALWLDRPRRALDRLFGHGPDQESARPPAPSPPAVVLPTPSATLPGVTARATPSRAHPLTVYLAGDSVADQVGDALTAVAAASKVVTVEDAARISTGLTRPDYYDWPARLRQVTGGPHAAAVIIVMFGANDIQPIMTADGPAAAGSGTWLAEYRVRVATTMSILAASGKDVIWLGQPIMRSGFFDARIRQLDAIYRSEAAGHPTVTYLDTRALLADAHGDFATYLPDGHGGRRRVRADDGVHLAPAGAQLVARAVMAVLDRHWDLPGGA